MEETSEREIISFRGTRQGILMSIIEDVPFRAALDTLDYKLKANSSFFNNYPISLDLGWREVDEEEIEDLLVYFKKQNVQLLGVISTSLNTRKVCEGRGLKVIIGRLGLADHHGRKKWEKEKTERQKNASEPKNANKVDTGETLLLKKTIRSGQTVEHRGNLVIVGNINPGAEVKAGKDLIIMGTLKGTAYAGTTPGNDDISIIATKFEPTRIQIKDISLNKFHRKFTRSKEPVKAYLKKGQIELEICS
ncbi:MAG: septum site-determining protein MinC [Vulcanimicrobiota bacterium]